VFRGFLSTTTAEFTMGIDALAKQRIDPLPRFKPPRTRKRKRCSRTSAR
jgi:hypothetical protein